MLAIYCRISKDGFEKRSIETQQAKGVEFANDLKLKYRVYIDKGLSGGSSREGRPELDKMLTDVEEGIVTSIYLANQDRIARNEGLWFEIANIVINYQVKLYENGILIDLNESSEFTMRGIKSIFDADERRKTSKRFKDVLKRNAEQGRRFSFIQFGYAEDIDKKLKIDEKNSEIIKLIFEMSLNGKGVQAIAEHLNQIEIKTAYALHTNDKKTFTTRHGKIKEKKDVKWVGNTIKTIINNPIYKGQRYWSGKYYPAPAIFEEWYWEKVNENLKNNTNNRGQKIKHNYLLKNLLKCGKCGSNYYGKKRLGINGKNPKENYYMCASKRRGEENCGNKSISIDALDTLIWFHMIFEGRIKELIKLHFSNNDEIIKCQDEIENRIKSFAIEKESLEFQKGKIINAIAIDVITTDEAIDKLDNLRKGIQNIENIMRDEIKKRDELNNGIKEKTEIINLFQSLKNLDFEEKKELIKKFIKEIIIVGNEDASCNVSIKFNLFGMKDDVYIISKDRKSAHSYTINEKKGIDASFIRLNKFKDKLINI
jgi:site-specific DNA recombinase